MQEYTGIDAERLEQMEQRLKADIIKEASLHADRLLIAREVMGSEDGQSASIVDDFVPVTGHSRPDPFVPQAFCLCPKL